jgi:hypothetical protein
MGDTSKAPARSTLEATPERALHFLTGAGRNKRARRLLETVGFDQAAYQQGWRLLQAAAGYENDGGAPIGTSDAAVVEAMKAIDAWDNLFFTRAAAVLEFDFPSQYERLFAGGLHAEQGPASVLAVKTFLDRLDALGAGDEADRAALAALARVGLHAGERDRARSLLVAAQSLSPLPAEVAPDGDPEVSQRELWQWYRKWSTLARTAVIRRADLIALGLASRRRPSGGEDPGEDA